MILDIIKEKTKTLPPIAEKDAGEREPERPPFEALKLRRVKLNRRERICTFNFAFPVLLDDMQKETIYKIVKEASPPYYKIKLKFDKDYLDLRAVRDLFEDFLGNFQAIRAALSTNDLSYCCAEDGFCVSISVSPEVGKLLDSSDFSEKFAKHISVYTNYKIHLKRITKGSEIDLEERIRELEEQRDLNISAQLSMPSRKIRLESVREFIGRAVETTPKYILDVHVGEELTIVCGKMHNPTTFKARDKAFYICKFDLQDFSADISCIFFAKNEADLKKFMTLRDGDEIVVRGKTSINSFSNCEQVTVYQMSRCKIASDDGLAFESRPPAVKYMMVEPEPYIEPNQLDIISDKVEPPQFFKENEVVVFDFETTGLKVLEDKIIEIGAVKIVDGNFKETFSTLINPQRRIDSKITELTGISDEMVATAPTIQQVMGDLYKFCFGSVMVAHNLEFDYGFLRYFARPSGYLFDNKKLDTLELSRKFFSLEDFRGEEPGKFTLDALTRHFEIPLDNAHRSLCDAVATARLLKKMLEKAPNLV